MIDIKLVKRAIKGDENSFEMLVKTESDKLYKTAFLYVGNKEDALDVVQETIYKAFVSIHQLNQPEYFSTWLIKILIRSAYQILNKNKKIILTGDEKILTSLEKNDVKSEQPHDLAYAISTLELNYQTVIILFYYHDYTIQSIANLLMKPEGTIKTYLRRAKIQLKKVLEEEMSYEQRMV